MIVKLLTQRKINLKYNKTVLISRPIDRSLNFSKRKFRDKIRRNQIIKYTVSNREKLRKLTMIKLSKSLSSKRFTKIRKTLIM